MIELGMIRDIVTIFGVIAGFSYYVMTVRSAQRTRELTLKAQEHATETRQAQLFMQIHAQWGDRAFIKGFYDILNVWEWKDWDDFWAKYGQSANEDAFITMVEIGWYFEGVGQLLRDGLIDIRLVDAMYSDRVIRYWEKAYPIIVGLREMYRNPDYYGNFEYLYKELMEYHEEHQEPKT